MPSGRVAVELRHLAIHEDEIERRVVRQLERLSPVLCQVDREAELLEDSSGKLLVHRVVFGEERPETFPVSREPVVRDVC